jgi:hypothetical protein
MGAGKNLKSAYGRQTEQANKTFSMANTLSDQAQSAFGQRSQYLQKPIEYFTDMASGDQTKMLAAAAPGIANISRQAQGAKGAIQDTVAPGAARNFAMAMVDRDKSAQNAQFLNQAWLSAFPALQGIANDTGNFGLQQLGASLNSYGQAGQSNRDIIQSETARKQAKMNMIGGLASMAGGGLMGGLSKMGSKGAAGASKQGMNFSGINLPNVPYMPPSIPNTTPSGFINMPLNGWDNAG